MDYKLVDLEVFKETQAPKINYSNLKLDNCIQLVPCGLLAEKNIAEQPLKVDWKDGIPYFYKTADSGAFKYDLFAAVFFMVSRYEEYLPAKLDHHKRFSAENSVAFKEEFLGVPVVNLWALELKKEILKQYPSTIFAVQNYQFINSLDIDIAYAFKGKSVLRLMSSTAKAVLAFDGVDLKNRFNYFVKNKKDPYDVYDKIVQLKAQYHTQNLYFFLLGDYATYDKNLSHNAKPLQQLIKQLAKENEVGIHPSYASNFDKKQVKVELNRLEQICGRSVQKSRQHFLKLSFPDTYENLIFAGIKEDYSMGFASQLGFRAGICAAYPFFNLKMNEERDLLITPFQVMDGTLNEYLKLQPKEAVNKLKEIVTAVRNVNGTFVSLWHNSSLAAGNNWKNWEAVYESLLQLAHQKNK